MASGYRESTESWASLLRDLRRRGMRAPVLAVDDGALGFWGALDEVFPQCRHQRDRVHKAANVLDALPTSVQRRAKEALAEISNAENKQEAGRAVDRFGRGVRGEVAEGRGQAHGRSRRPTRVLRLPGRALDPSEDLEPHQSTFAAVRARTKVTKGPGSTEAALPMAFKLLQATGGRWRGVNALELVTLVRAEATFVNGKLERSEDEGAA